MKKIYLSFLLLVAVSLGANSQTSLLTENFDDVSLMLSSGGWSEVNNSLPLGLETWHNGTGLAIPAYNGFTDSYAEVSFNSTSATGTGDISNWLISPTMMLNNGDVVTFYATSYNNVVYPDRLELRLNPLNTTNVGSAPSDEGDFTVLLTSLNPTLLPDTSYFPQNYWGLVTATVSGLTGATNCRLAFRYWVIDGGGGGTNSSTIGIDQFDVTTIVGIHELESFKTSLYPNPAHNLLSLTWNQALTENTVATVYNAMGQKVATKEISKGVQHASMDVSTLSNGVYTVHLTGSASNSRSTFVKN